MEPLDNELNSAHNAIDQLFGCMGITRVVCVDDEYARSINVEDVIGYCAGMKAGDLSGIPLVSDFVALIDDNEDVFNDRLRDNWKEFDEDQRKDVYRKIWLRSGFEKEPDIGTALQLRKILSNHDFQELSLTEWKEKKDSILKEAKENNTLILFDQDMTIENGTDDEGIKQIVAIIPTEGLPGVYCGLLSHTGLIDEEPEKWEQLSNSYGVPKSNFLFIAKNRLDRPLGFARMLKLMTISPDCHSLNIKAKEIYGTAIDKAKEEIDKIGIYDFEHIVFSHSQEEGTWEPDTLFRLYSLFHRKNTIQAARECKDLNTLVNRIRKVSHIPLPSKAEETPKHNSWRIQKEELYMDADYINGLHLPIELGDIFEFTKEDGKTKKYVLLCQPCDLMVRPKKDGNPGGRHHTVNESVIAEINEFDKNEPENGDTAKDKILISKPDPFASQVLSYYSDLKDKESYVMFRKTQNIRLSILDLCVLQPDGIAKIEIEKDCPEGVIPAWQDHYKRLQKEFKKAVNRFKRINEAVENKVKKDDIQHVLNAIIPPSSLTNTFKGKIDGQTVEYPLKRIGRINQTRAVAILSRYAGFLARTAFDRDFGEEIGN